MYLDENTPYSVEIADRTTLFNSKSVGEWLSGPVGGGPATGPEGKLQLYLRRNPIVRSIKRILKKQTSSAKDGLNAKLVSWNNITHTTPHRLGLVMSAGSRVVFNNVKIPYSGRGVLVCGPALSKVSADGMDIIARFRPDHKRKSSEITLAEYHFSEFDPEEPWVELQFPLDAIEGASGALVLECAAGPNHDARNDLLALYECVLSAEDTLRLNRARAFSQHRMRNELQFFKTVYDHKIYELEDDPEEMAAA